jgi:hypothetical protein
MTEQPAPTGHIYGRKDFTWSEHPDGWALHAMGHCNAIVGIVPDGTRPGMWRIRHPGGRLSYGEPDLGEGRRDRGGDAPARSPENGRTTFPYSSPMSSEGEPARVDHGSGAPALLAAGDPS